MALTLTLIPSSGSITALVDGLDTTYEKDRIFVWQLDGAEIKTETVAPGSERYEYLVKPVYFNTLHTIAVDIYNPNNYLLASLSGTAHTTLPVLDMWTWNNSNGEATAAQTQAAYSALINKELTSNFSRMVWNDLVSKVAELREESGISWRTRYGNLDSTLMPDPYSALSAARFNAVVDNLQYPFWTWDNLPTSDGYLGRLAVKGASTMGPNADDVYGAYLLELVKRLNTMIGVYTETGNLVYPSISHNSLLTTSPLLRADHSAPLTIVQNPTLSIYPNGHASPVAPVCVDLPATLTLYADLIAVRWRLFLADLFLHNEIIAPLATSPSFRIAAAVGGNLAFSLNLGTGVLKAFTTQNPIELSQSAALGLIGLAGLLAENNAVFSLSAALETQELKSISASVSSLLMVGNKSIAAQKPIGLNYLEVAHLLALQSTADAGEPIVIAATVGAEVKTAGNIICVQFKPISAELEANMEPTAEIEMGIPFPLTLSDEESLSTSASLAKVAYIPLAASISSDLFITATEGNAEPGELWKEQIGTEMTIWRTINSRQRKDIVLVDIDPRSAEMSASVSITAEQSAKAFVSRGWEFPKRLPNSKGRMLLVKQLLRSDVQNDAWGWLREGEFELWQLKSARQREDLVLADIDPKPAELSANVGGTVTLAAISQISRGWQFPERYPHSEGRIVIVHQSLSATQTNEEVEVI